MMKDIDYLEYLKLGEKCWNKYRSKHPEALDLSGSDLSDLRDLRSFNFEDCDLSSANLSGCDLRLANLDRTNLAGANLEDSKLCLAKLNDADLTTAELGSADLQDASLEYAKLGRVDLMRCNLTGARLNKAYLRQANLSGATLCQADLSGANLTGSNLTGADLYGANLYHAEIASTIFGNLDLSGVNNLDKVLHLGPSVVGVHTILLSKGNIPGVFLRSAGIPEGFILAVPSMKNQSGRSHTCVISYSHADAVFVNQLCQALDERQVGCWRDVPDMPEGTHIVQEVAEAMRKAGKVLLCCSENSLTSGWVAHEIEIALGLEREQERTDAVLFPLDLDGYKETNKWKSPYREIINARKAFDFTDWHDEEENFLRFGQRFDNVAWAIRR